MEGLACQAWNLMMGCHWSASSRKINLEKPEAEKVNRPMPMPGQYLLMTAHTFCCRLGVQIRRCASLESKRVVTSGS